jgi:hypothetical protein
MIQIRRGSTEKWHSKDAPILAPGQPGYDKDSRKIKIGDGEKSWSELPNAGGMSEEEIFSSEAEAKIRRKTANALLPLNPKLAKLISPAIITYGTDSPDVETIGRLYLQYYDAEPEVDYIVETGTDGIWQYRKWHSGIAECFGTLKLSTTVQSTVDNTTLYSNSNVMKEIDYPFTFKDVPNETATLQSPGGFAWLASKGSNTTKQSAIYGIISTDKQINTANYGIVLKVEGRWR